ncbi:MAG: DUF2202 domain-containing protein [Sedimentisphaerales bacterium]|nr:DUF2202 domain-containing protein [Sedimentisphaerales bacterium]
MKAKALLTAAALFTTLVGLTYAAGPAQRGGGTALAPLSAEEIKHITYMREEEKVARDVYLTMAELWDCPVFANVSVSEQRHMDAVGRLIAKHGLTDPVVDDTPGVFTNAALGAMYSDFTEIGTASLEGALEAGRQIEVKDIEDLTAALAETTAPDVTRVFENLLNGSNNHLAAFTRAIETGCTPICDGTGRCGLGLGAGNGAGRGNGPQGLAGMGRGMRLGRRNGNGFGQGQGLALRDGTGPGRGQGFGPRDGSGLRRGRGFGARDGSGPGRGQGRGGGRLRQGPRDGTGPNCRAN